MSDYFITSVGVKCDQLSEGDFTLLGITQFSNAITVLLVEANENEKHVSSVESRKCQ